MLRRPLEGGPSLNDDLIKVLVGKPKAAKPFTIHQDTLCSSSDFFKAALRSPWKENAERTIKLPTQSRLAFGTYAKWLYSQKLYMKRQGDDIVKTSEDGANSYSSREFALLASCYQLGDYVQDDDFQDACLDAMIEKMVETTRYYSKWGKAIYPHSRKGSPHRKLVVEMLANVSSGDHLKEYAEEECPRDLLADLILKAATDGLVLTTKRKKVAEFFGGLEICVYHLHTAKGESCYKDK